MSLNAIFRFPDLQAFTFTSVSNQVLNSPQFCAVNVFRILMGYLFLVNVLLVLIQASDVLTIFYDVLALQFVQQLDDIGFRLARMDVFGRRLQKACTMGWFDAEFEYRKGESFPCINRFPLFAQTLTILRSRLLEAQNVFEVSVLYQFALVYICNGCHIG